MLSGLGIYEHEWVIPVNEHIIASVAIPHSIAPLT